MTREQFRHLSIRILGFGIYRGDYKNLEVKYEENIWFEEILL